jgi:hypothetical protein
LCFKENIPQYIVISARTLFNPKNQKYNKWTVSVKPVGKGRFWKG